MLVAASPSLAGSRRRRCRRSLARAKPLRGRARRTSGSSASSAGGAVVSSSARRRAGRRVARLALASAASACDGPHRQRVVRPRRAGALERRRPARRPPTRRPARRRASADARQRAEQAREEAARRGRARTPARRLDAVERAELVCASSGSSPAGASALGLGLASGSPAARLRTARDAAAVARLLGRGSAVRGRSASSAAPGSAAALIGASARPRLGRRRRRRRVVGSVELARDRQLDLGAPAGGLDDDAAAGVAGLPLDALLGLDARDADLAELAQVAGERAGSLISAHSSGGDLTSVRCTSEEIIAASLRATGR